MIRPQPYSTGTRAGDSTHVVQEIITERSESRGLTLHSVCENNLWLRDQSWLDARNVSRRDSHNALGRPRPWRVHGNNDRRHRVLDIHKKGLAPRDTTSVASRSRRTRRSSMHATLFRHQIQVTQQAASFQQFVLVAKAASRNCEPYFMSFRDTRSPRRLSPGETRPTGGTRATHRCRRARADSRAIPARRYGPRRQRRASPYAGPWTNGAR